MKCWKDLGPQARGPVSKGSSDAQEYESGPLCREGESLRREGESVRCVSGEYETVLCDGEALEPQERKMMATTVKKMTGVKSGSSTGPAAKPQKKVSAAVSAKISGQNIATRKEYMKKLGNE